VGVIIKYQLEFPEVGLKVSNDLADGEFILDADITAKMKRGMEGGSFEIKLYDLPLEKAKAIKEKAKAIKEKAGTLARVIIKLGYFDGPFEKVMEGVIEKMRSTVQDDKLVSSLEGHEIGTYALQNTEIDITLDPMPITEAVKKVLQDAVITKGEITRTPELQDISNSDRLGARTFRGKLMRVLDQLAAHAHSEFLVSDKTVWLGKPIRDTSYDPPELERDTNLAGFSPIDKEIPDEVAPDLSNPLKATQVEGYRFTMIGDPKLRPGHKVVAVVDDYDEEEFRVHSVTHKFNQSGGYVCEGAAIKACEDDNCRRREKELFLPSAENTVERLTERNETEQRNRPIIEIGKVKTYSPGEATGAERHLSTLYFRQRFERTETQPSINVEVDTNEQQLFQNKPMASPFAWHKCGLVVPVYPGMKAALHHNVNLPDDVLVTGFIWSEQPLIEPPKNKEGDWWLCLPIDFDASNPPGDSTKAVNDLIANNGKRVIEVNGLKITIGQSKLPNVGARPSEGADDEFLIEHKSGTKFTIAADGALAIEAQNISLKGNVTVEGKVDVK